jgi:hypothetical protein
VRKTQIAIAAVVAFVVVAFVVLAVSSSGRGGDLDRKNAIPAIDPVSNSPEAQTAEPIPNEAARLVAPPSSGLTVHPYELLKNPFKWKAQLVLLELRSRPVLFNGAVVQYSGDIQPKFGVQLGVMALRLNRMLAENQALYDVMGVEAGSSEGQMLGQVSVTLPPNVTDLDLARIWAVEPQGTIQGTNGFGATISIPSVRFWRYQDGVQEAKENGQLQALPSVSNSDAGDTVGQTLDDQRAEEPISVVKKHWHAKPEHDPPPGVWWAVQLSSHDSNWDYVQVRYQDSKADPICQWIVGTYKGQGRTLYSFGQVNAAARAEFEAVPAD